MTAEGRLRVGYRLALYAVAFAVASVAGGLTRAGLLKLAAPQWVAALGLAAAAIGIQRALTLLLRRHVDGRPVEGLALGPLRRGWAQAALGAAVAAAMLGAVFAGQLALGWITITDATLPGGTVASTVDQLAALALLFVSVGYNEELLMRGAVLQNLGESMPLWAAAAITGVLFGLAHAITLTIGPGFVVSAVVMTGMLALARVVTGSLWFAIGGHLAWDFLQECVLGLTLGTGVTKAPLLRLQQTGPAAWVGVPPALEGGLLYIAVEALGLLALLWLLRRKGLSLSWRLAPTGELAPPTGAEARAGQAALALDGRPVAPIAHEPSGP